jgi:hypothetical protein
MLGISNRILRICALWVSLLEGKGWQGFSRLLVFAHEKYRVGNESLCFVQRDIPESS